MHRPGAPDSPARQCPAQNLIQTIGVGARAIGSTASTTTAVAIATAVIRVTERGARRRYTPTDNMDERRPALHGFEEVPNQFHFLPHVGTRHVTGYGVCGPLLKALLRHFSSNIPWKICKAIRSCPKLSPDPRPLPISLLFPRENPIPLQQRLVFAKRKCI